jgi:hypothetical protein
VNDDTDKRRRQYFEDYADRVDRHREGAAFYEQRAIELANNAFRQLTYLNGGGLLAIPTAMALFHVEAKRVTTQLLCAALAFAAGLVCVAASQGFAFFVMARRSEQETLLQYEQMESLRAVYYPGTPEELSATLLRSTEHHNSANRKMRVSNISRAIALVFVWTSLLLFIAGCWAGTWSVLAQAP